MHICPLQWKLVLGNASERGTPGDKGQQGDRGAPGLLGRVDCRINGGEEAKKSWLGTIVKDYFVP